MRTVRRGVSFAWLVLVGLVFTLPFPPFMRDPQRQRNVWQGATLDWSPKAAVGAAEGPAVWDVEGWLAQRTAELHRDLDRVEAQLWLNMDRLLAMVYEWSEG